MLGVFPISELGQAHAFKVKEATIKIIDEFAKPAAPMPYSKKERTLSLNQVEHFKLKVKVVFSRRVRPRGCISCWVETLAWLRTGYPKIEKIIRFRTEALTADAAADEQLALDSWQKKGSKNSVLVSLAHLIGLSLLHPKSKAALKGDFSDDSYFANVKLRIQDLAHAVRRLVL